MPPLDDAGIDVGDQVAMHWDYVCQRLSPGQSRNLRRYHDLHLAIANGFPASLGSRIET
jgi:hypothetical protein